MVSVLFCLSSLVSYAMNWLIVLPLEVTAGLKILQFWESSGSYDIPEAASVTIFLVVGYISSTCLRLSC